METEHVNEKKVKPDSIFLRTVIKRDVYKRLKKIAQEYSTGQGHWDFGVGVQILLEYYENSKQGLQSDKIDMILSLLQTEEEPKEEPKTIEMLGGSKEKI